MKKALLFDLDDTLLWDQRSVELALRQTCTELAPLFADKLYLAIREEAPQIYKTYPFYDFTQKIGINPFEGLWGSFADEQYDFPVMGDQIRNYQVEAWTKALSHIPDAEIGLANQLAERFIHNRKGSALLYEETLEVLSHLSSKFPLALITNGAPSLQNLKLEMTPELRPFFQHVIISGDVGIGKPDAGPFQVALERLKCKPDEVLMIGDNVMTDILGASRLGIDTVWINHHDAQAPRDIKPTHTIPKLKDLLSIVN